MHWCRCENVSNVVHWCRLLLDIFWTRPNLVKLMNFFNIVILVYSTYKMNKYRMLLLKIVGNTSTSGM